MGGANKNASNSAYSLLGAQGLDADGIAGLLGGERTEAKGLLGRLTDIIDTDDDGSIVDDVLNMGSKLGKLFR